MGALPHGSPTWHSTAAELHLGHAIAEHALSAINKRAAHSHLRFSGQFVRFPVIAIISSAPPQAPAKDDEEERRNRGRSLSLPARSNSAPARD